MYRLRQVTPPTGNIITKDDAKQWLSESSDHSDAVIEDLIQSVTEELDGRHSILSSSVLPQTWEVAYWSFPMSWDGFELPLPPVNRVNSFEYDGADGMVHTIDDYALVEKYGKFFVYRPQGWGFALKENLTTERIRIEYDAGYETGTPAGIRQAALAMLSHQFDNRNGQVRTGFVPNPSLSRALLNFDRK